MILQALVRNVPEFSSTFATRKGAPELAGLVGGLRDFEQVDHVPKEGLDTLTGIACRSAAGSGYEQAKAKLRCIESDEVAVAFGPPA